MDPRLAGAGATFTEQMHMPELEVQAATKVRALPSHPPPMPSSYQTHISQAVYGVAGRRRSRNPSVRRVVQRYSAMM
jgi:hypothetical protein